MLTSESAAALIGSGSHDKTPEEDQMPEADIAVKVVSAFYGKAMKLYKEGEKVSLPASQARELIASNRAVVDDDPKPGKEQTK